jgi:hypothetical protein
MDHVLLLINVSEMPLVMHQIIYVVVELVRSMIQLMAIVVNLIYYLIVLELLEKCE